MIRSDNGLRHDEASEDPAQLRVDAAAGVSGAKALIWWRSNCPAS
jgi:hypothetical protein